MDRKEAKRLKIGDRLIIWANGPDVCTGSVIETGYNAVIIEWDDGQIGSIHFDDFADVAHHEGPERIVPMKEKES